LIFPFDNRVIFETQPDPLSAIVSDGVVSYKVALVTAAMPAGAINKSAIKITAIAFFMLLSSLRLFLIRSASVKKRRGPEILRALVILLFVAVL
jgi:hypothetical protein